MGVTNQFQEINRELTESLGYHLDPERAESFRSLLAHAGIRRTRKAIEIVKAQNLPFERRHKALVSQIWDLIPPKTTKYRNPQVQHMKVAEREALEYAMAKDGD
jgi:hypothetical protein